MDGFLWLADGSRHRGTLVGACGLASGELVFNTSMTGYQEILTDPSYHRQIVVLTHPEIGNYGCHPQVSESELGHAAGMVFRHLSPGSWHRTRQQDFGGMLAAKGITAITALDTRWLTRRIREKGPQNALIAPAAMDEATASEALAKIPPMAGANLVPEVSVSSPERHGEGETHIVLMDFGIKTATIRALAARNCTVTLVPWNFDIEKIAALSPDGVLLSNGPGDPAALTEVCGTVAAAMERWPVMGICLGFQIMAIALGGKTYKLPFGHRGGNHPVRWNGRVVITSQNHGFAVVSDSLDPALVELTHHSLFDGSLEGFHLRKRPVFGVQFHPEAAPGPHDCLDHFDHFLSLVRGRHA